MATLNTDTGELEMDENEMKEVSKGAEAEAEEAEAKQALRNMAMEEAKAEILKQLGGLSAPAPAPAEKPAEQALTPVQPEETFHQEPHALAVHVPKDRRLMVDAPGYINIARDGGGYPGCRAFTVSVSTTTGGSRKFRVDGLSKQDGEAFSKQLAEALNEDPLFGAADAVNLFFEKRANLLTVFLRLDVGFAEVHYTNNLEGERLEYFREYSRRLAAGMEEWEQSRQEKLAKEFEEQETKAKELQRLADIGARVEKDNLVNAYRRTAAKLKKARALLFKSGGKELVDQLGEDDASDQQS